MRATKKFFRHRNGISSFAAVTLETTPPTSAAVAWASSAGCPAEYRDAVISGIAIAHDAHAAIGGQATCFRVVEVVELLADTKADAVLCAAAGAAWVALGHSIAEVRYEFVNAWRASITPGSSLSLAPR